MKKFAIVAISIALFSSCKKSEKSTPSNSNLLTSGAFTNLFSFTGSDGGTPYGDLIYSNGVLYGMTQYGGSNTNQYGNIFSMNTNGTNFLNLHNFVNTDGAYPFGDLLLSGGVLYGMAVNGGASNNGTLFAMNTNGSGFRVIHTFTGTGTDGSQPTGSVICIGNTLYGMTTAGGTLQAGNIFSINVNGSNYRNLFSFSGGDGGNPNGSLTLSASGDSLFGMARLGGIHDSGLVFSIDTNGNTFTVLYNFGGVSTNGATPVGNVVLEGYTLYGMTSAGGLHGHGCIFSLTTNGTGYTDLFDFNGSSTGSTPLGSLVVSGTTMYGMTSAGGSAGYGLLFSMGTNGSNYNMLFNFTGSFGTNPDGSLILVNNMLYGMASLGGVNSSGIIFSYQL